MRVFDIRSYGAIGDDSTNNTTAIQAALDDASTNGGAVYVPYGTFRTGTISIGSNVTIFGDGYGSCLKLRNSANNFLLVASDDADYQDNIIIHHLQFDGNKANNSAGGGILLAGRQNVVHHCYIHDTAYTSIQSGWPHDGATERPLVGNLLIHDNICVNPGTSAINYSAIAITHGSRIQIHNNICQSTDGYMTAGIDIEANPDNIIDTVQIVSNTIVGGRLFLDCSALSSPGTNIVVHDNYVDARGVGSPTIDTICPIFVRTISRLSITNNVLVGHEDGYQGGIAVFAPISVFKISGNLIIPSHSTTVGYTYGIFFENQASIATDGVISDNYIYGAETILVGISSPHATGLVRVAFHGNRFYNCTKEYAIEATLAGGTGIDAGLTQTRTASWDPGNTADNATATTNITFPGAVIGDHVWASFYLADLSAGLPANWLISASVTAADTVTVNLLNKTGGAVNLAAGTVRVVLQRFKNEPGTDQ